ncbi:MAG: LuxR family transcriptional regulator [Alphaproteobacteria bacterium]|nr:hypothetical protein [Hyphomonas sp.]MBR9806789.1 LuxR family transcriptional regulator [Alphaproteobacteria bacterium]
MATSMESLRTFFRDCRKADSLADLRLAAVTYYKTTSVKMASYMHFPPVGARDFNGQIRIAEFGYPEEWRRTYLRKRLYQNDPLARRAPGFIRPYFWSEVQHFSDLTDEERSYIIMVSQEQLGEGLSVPVFGPAQRNGYCALGFGRGNPIPSDDEVLELQAACQMGHLAYCELLLKDLPRGTNLSSREREILYWIVRGQTNAQIAESTRLSRNTVETYIRRCFQKLDVNDRVSAALRGMALGMVD